METAAEETPKENVESVQPQPNVAPEETAPSPPEDPVQEAPVQTALVQGTSAQEAPTQDASAQEASAQGAPTQEPSVQGAATLEAPAVEAQETPKKSKSAELSKKEEKSIEQFMRSLNNLPSAEEKLSVVCKKYVQTTDEHKKSQFYIKQADKRYALLLKEKDQLQQEVNKTHLIKSKLENLCRELQKQNKNIKEDSLLKIREEEERRRETQTKFQTTLTEITALLQQNNEKNAKLRDDNISMTEKFKSVVQQYQLREQQVEKMAKQMALESQLSDAKMQKAALEHQAEKEMILAEMEQLKLTLKQYSAKITELQETEKALRGQLSVYTDKYDEFQTALVRSNQMFSGFKDEMSNMSKKILKLEKESLSWKNRWETSQAALLEMCSERQASEERAAAASRHLHQMQSLCRTLQAERSVLLGALKENNIERPPLPALPALPAPPAPPPASNAKVDAMAANCAQLRQSLAHLQSQLNTLTNKPPAKEEPPKPEKSKKSKSKKNKAEKQAQKALEKTEPEQKEPESDDSNSKSVSEEVQPSETEAKAPSKPVEGSEDKIDSKTMESFIQAINLANVNICDLNVVNDTDKVGVVIEEIVETESKKDDSVTDKAQSEINVDKDTNNALTSEATANKIAEDMANETTTKPTTKEPTAVIANDIANKPVAVEANSKEVLQNNLNNAQSSPKKETKVKPGKLKAAMPEETVKQVVVNGANSEIITHNLEDEKPKAE